MSENCGADARNTTGARCQSPAYGGSYSTCHERGSRSALGHSLHTRIQEKNELANLNDRLAAYIDRVSELETENSRLAQQIDTKQETRTHELPSVKTLYERELANARRAVDLAANENAKLQLEANKWQADSEALQTMLAMREHEWPEIERRGTELESRVVDLRGRLHQELARIKDAESERNNLAKELDKAKTELEDVNLRVANLDHKMNGLNQQRNFEASVYEKELEEQRVVTETEIRKSDTLKKDNYERKLASLLQELREQYEFQMQLNRKKVLCIYETKMRDLQDLLDRRSSDCAVTLDELERCKTRLPGINARIAELESLNNSLSSSVRDSERLLEEGRHRWTRALGEKEEEIQWLGEDIEEQLAEYRDLLEIKAALDLEIAAYSKLLEGEETRLNIAAYL